MVLNLEEGRILPTAARLVLQIPACLISVGILFDSIVKFCKLNCLFLIIFVFILI